MRRTLCSKASLAVELKCFKEAVRYVADNDLQEQQRAMFQGEARQHLRRLKQFRLKGHHPAINATVRATAVEAAVVEEAILDQRQGTTRKLAAHVRRTKAEEGEGEQRVFKLKRAAVGMASIKWKRAEDLANTAAIRGALQRRRTAVGLAGTPHGS